MQSYGLNSSFLEEGQLKQLGFSKLGKNVKIHETAVLVNCGRMEIGDDVRIDPFTVISAGTGIILGRNVHIASHSSLVGERHIQLGDFAGLSQGVRIFSSSDDYTGATLTNPTVPAEYKNVQRGNVRLGRHVIVGAGAVILPAVEIGEGSAIGALSLVNKSLLPWSIYTGVPARRIGERKRDLLALEAQFRASEHLSE